MDTTHQLEGLVNNLVKDIETKLNDRLNESINATINKRIENFDFNKTIAYLASVKLDTMLAAMELDGKAIDKRISAIAGAVLESIKADTQNQINATVSNHLAGIDINSTLRTTIAAEVTQLVRRIEFPNKSIPHGAIDFDGLKISGDNVTGGIMRKFGSTGIDDRAESCQVTILDAATVVENKLIVGHLEVKGITQLEGDIILRGQVPTDTQFFQDLVAISGKSVLDGMNANLFANYSSVIFDKIREEGLDLNRITINGSELIKGNQLSYAISDTNITRVGQLKELQVSGEALINQTLYVGKDKVGINTLEPGFALTVWDEEIELGAGKRKRDVGFFGIMGRGDLILTANAKDNIVLGADGSVQVESIKIKNITISSGATTPTTESTRGTVLFNENPEIGSPVGWVCLGGQRWASFGNLN